MKYGQQLLPAIIYNGIKIGLSDPQTGGEGEICNSRLKKTLDTCSIIHLFLFILANPRVSLCCNYSVYCLSK